jgi:hypothetical protein
VSGRKVGHVPRHPPVTCATAHVHVPEAAVGCCRHVHVVSRCARCLWRPPCAINHRTTRRTRDSSELARTLHTPPQRFRPFRLFMLFRLPPTFLSGWPDLADAALSPLSHLSRGAWRLLALGPHRSWLPSSVKYGIEPPHIALRGGYMLHLSSRGYPPPPAVGAWRWGVWTRAGHEYT